MPASRATSRRLRLEKPLSGLSWAKAASIIARRVRSFCCALLKSCILINCVSVILFYTLTHANCTVKLAYTCKLKVPTMEKPPIIWTNVLVFAVTFTIAAVGIPAYEIMVGFTWMEIVATILCLGYCGMSITAGYHRLWAHKTYDAHPILQWIFAIFKKKYQNLVIPKNWGKNQTKVEMNEKIGCGNKIGPEIK